MKKAHIHPMEVGYTVDMCIGCADYAIKLVLDKQGRWRCSRPTVEI